MVRHRRARASKGTWLVSLLAVSLGLWLLPAAWTGRLMSLVQVIVPFQAAADKVGDVVGDAVHGPPDAIPAAAYHDLEARHRALERLSASLSVALTELEAENRILTALRSEGVGGAGLQTGRLIPARVVASDLVPWRSSRSIDAGTLRGVRRGAPVTSRVLDIDRGRADGLLRGMAILRAESLIGVVADTGTHTARVMLLTDVDAQRVVRIGSFTADGFHMLPGEHWLVGRGRGVMEIRDVAWTDAASGRVRVGDVVLSDPNSEALPVSLTIGRITAIEHDLDHPQLAVVTLRPAVDEASIERVYVFDPQREPGG